MVTEKEVQDNIDQLILSLKEEIALWQKMKLGISQHYAKLVKEAQYGKQGIPNT